MLEVPVRSLAGANILGANILGIINTHVYCLAVLVHVGFYSDVDVHVSFYSDVVVFASDVRGPRFDPRPGQGVFSIFPPVTFDCNKKHMHTLRASCVHFLKQCDSLRPRIC